MKWIKQYRLWIVLAFVALAFSSCYVYGPPGSYGYGHGHYHHGYYHHY